MRVGDISDFTYGNIRRTSAGDKGFFQIYLCLGSGSGTWSWPLCVLMKKVPRTSHGGSPSPAHTRGEDTQRVMHKLFSAL